MPSITANSLINEIVTLDLIDSTNRYALDAGHKGLLVVARAQSAGRGRKGRAWFSPPNTNIYMTLTLGAPDGRYAIVTGVAVRAALAALVGEEAGIRLKWPNDVQIAGRKVCGILCEARAGITALGIGINVNQTAWPEDLQDIATSLTQVTGRNFMVDDVMREVLEHLDTWFGCYARQGFAPVREQFRIHGLHPGRIIELEDGSRGHILDLDENGYLVVDVAGAPLTVISGDIVFV